MMKSIVLAILTIILFTCCSERPDTTGRDERSTDTTITAYEDEADTPVAQNSFEQLLDRYKEPDLRTLDKVAYRYFYERSFTTTAFIFTVLVDSNYEAYLTTKMVASVGQHNDSNYVNYMGGFYIHSDTVLRSHLQKMTEEEYFNFLDIIRGSYFWVLENPYPLGSGYTDGDFLLLETRTRLPMTDTLTYHTVGIHVPFEGSFTNACRYLAEISRMREARMVETHLGRNK